MRKIGSEDIREAGVFKHYRVVRKWVVKNYEIAEGDLEILIYLDCLDLFKRHDFESNQLTYSWDKARWLRLKKNGWVSVWRERNNTTRKYNIYKVSYKGKRMINRMYRILLGEEEMTYKFPQKKYSERILKNAVDSANKDLRGI
jgi:hypothetical protein